MRLVKWIPVALFVTGLVLATGAIADDDAKQKKAAKQFEMLKRLVGTWVQVDEEGKPTDVVVSRCRLTAGGSAILEELFDRFFRTDGYRRHLDSVTDLVLADAQSMSRRLASEDRGVLDEFLAMVRDVELRIERLEALLRKATPEEPPEERLPRGEYIRLQADLMLLALQMGITNVCTFMIGPERWDATLRYETLFEKPVQHHNMTHNQKGEGFRPIADIDRFHVAQFAYIVSRMKSMREEDGSTLLDNSMLTYGAGIGDGATHQFFDLPMVLAGGGQGEAVQGRFLRLESGTLTSNLWLSLARWMGLDLESYADSTGEISELWV